MFRDLDRRGKIATHVDQAVAEGREGQRWRGKLRHLHDAGPARPRDRARQFPRHQSEWPLFFALMSTVSRETEFTKFVSEEIATVRSRHSSRRRRIPMPASPRRRARCDRHEARAGTAAFLSCCLVRLSNGGLCLLDEIVSLPACTQRFICRGAASASRLDPLGGEGGRSNALFFSLCPTEHPFQIQKPVHFSCDPENWTDKPPPSQPMGSQPDDWRNELCYRVADIEGHPGPKPALPLRGRLVLVQDVLPTTAQHYDVAVSEYEKILASQRHSWTRRARQPRSQRIGSCLHPMSSNPDQDKRALSSLA